MVAYFCHHLSYNYVDLSDLYVDLSAKNQQRVNASNCYLHDNLISDKSTSLQSYLTSRHNFLTSRLNDRTSRQNNLKSFFQTIKLTCQMLYQLVR